MILILIIDIEKNLSSNNFFNLLLWRYSEAAVWLQFAECLQAANRLEDAELAFKQVCMYVYMYLCIFVCTYVFLYVYVCMYSLLKYPDLEKNDYINRQKLAINRQVFPPLKTLESKSRLHISVVFIFQSFLVLNIRWIYFYIFRLLS